MSFLPFFPFPFLFLPFSFLSFSAASLRPSRLLQAVNQVSPSIILPPFPPHPTPQVQLRVDVSFVRDALKGDETTEIRIKFLGLMEDEAPPDDD